MNKYLKIALTIFSLLGVLIIVGAVFVFRSLPSASEIGSALRKPKPAAQNTVVPAQPATVIVSDDHTAGSEAAVQKNDEVGPANNKLDQALFDDLTSSSKPLSDFCTSLKNAKDGAFTEEEFGPAINQSTQEDHKDARIQAVKPMLRYVMRLPRVTDMLEEAESAVSRKDESFFNKAEFYAKALSAFTEMKDHKSDIESVMDRSYLLLGLNKLIAQKPDLLNDPRIQNYCTSVELSFNQGTPVDFENEKKDFLKFLDDVNVKPSDIGFNTDYKSDVQLHFSGRSLSFEGGWLSDLVKTDVEMKAEVERKVN